MDDMLPEYMKKNGRLSRYDGPGTEPVGPSKELLDPKLQAIVDPWDPSTFEEPNPQNTGVLTKEMLDSMGQQVGEALSPVTGGPTPPPEAPAAPPLPGPSPMAAPAAPGAPPDPVEQRKVEIEDRVAQLQPLRPEDKVGEASPDLRNPLTGEEPMSLQSLSKQISELQGRQDRSQRAGMAGSVLGALSAILGSGLMAAGRAKGKPGLFQAGAAVGQSGGALNQLLQVPGKNVQQRLANLQDQYNDAFNRDIRGKENQRGERRLQMEEEMQPLEVAKAEQSLEAGDQAMEQRAQQMELAGSAEERAQATFELEQEAMRQAQNMSDDELRQAVLRLSPGTPPNALDNANHRELMSLYAQFQVADKKAKRRGGGSGKKTRDPRLDPPPAAWKESNIRSEMRANNMTRAEAEQVVLDRWNRNKGDEVFRRRIEAMDDEFGQKEAATDTGVALAVQAADSAMGVFDRLPGGLASAGGQALDDLLRKPSPEMRDLRASAEAMGTQLAIANNPGGRVTDADRTAAVRELGLPTDTVGWAQMLNDPEYGKRAFEQAKERLQAKYEITRDIRSGASGNLGASSTVRVRLTRGPKAGQVVSVSREQAESNPGLFEVVE